MKTWKTCRWIGLTAVVLCSFASDVRAQSGSETLSDFGYLGQGNAAVNGSQAVMNNSCVPTATANGLSYLENYFNFSLDLPSPFTTSPNNYAAVNSLQGLMGTTALGTTVNGLFNGLQSYLMPGGANPAPTVSISGQYSSTTPGGWFSGGINGGLNVAQASPTASFLANALNANDGVEVGIQWGAYSGNTFTASGGGHMLTLYSINLGVSGSGTIGFIDPWGTGTGNNAGTSATVVNATVQLVNGFLYVTYPIDFTGPDPADTTGTDGTTQLGHNGETGRILVDAVEAAAVPEATTTIAGALLLLPLGVSTLRILRKKRMA